MTAAEATAARPPILMIVRYLFGSRGSALINGAVDSVLGKRTDPSDIEVYIGSLVN